MKMNPSRERYIETQVRTGSFEEKSGKGLGYCTVAACGFSFHDQDY